jgi:hypothetical protein
MKNRIRYFICFWTASFCVSTYGQDIFQNLNFEAANVTGNGGYVSTANGLPGWAVYYGGVQQSQMGYNLVSLGAVNVTLLNVANGAIDGNYSVLLQGGEGNGGPAAASISQTGLIPAGTQTLYFKGESGNDPLNVSIDNQNVSYVAIQTGPVYNLYAANISAWADTAELLTFSAPSLSGETDNWELDDISFSSVAITPEPSSFILTGLGGVIFALRQRFRSE